MRPETELYLRNTLRSSQFISLHATISINKEHHLRIHIASIAYIAAKTLVCFFLATYILRA